MKCSDAKIFTYDIPLTGTLLSKGQKIRRRSGIILQLISDRGAGFGEIAPLPQMSPESLAESTAQTLKFCRHVRANPLEGSPHDAASKLRRYLSGNITASSVKFGIESAFSRIAGMDTYLNANFKIHNVLLNGFIPAECDDYAAKIDYYVENNYRSVKVKLGTQTVTDDIEFFGALVRRAKGKLSFRVDVNKRWGYQEACIFAQNIDKDSLEYIEEPFADIGLIKSFYEQTQLPIAVDESLALIDQTHLNPEEGIAAVVIKPTLRGGIHASYQLARECLAKGLKVTISSSFETGVGLASCAELVAIIGENHAAGLDTLQYLSDPLIPLNKVKQQGSFSIEQFDDIVGLISIQSLKELPQK